MLLNSSIIKNDDGSCNVVIMGQGEPILVHSSHANYKTIAKGLLDGDDSLDYRDLADQRRAVEKRFQALSERVSVQNGRILLDGDVLDDSLTEQIVRFLDEGIEDWRPLVAFLENVSANPEDHSREQLYDWLRVQEGITITSNGLIVGYKGVHKNGDGSLVSGYAGQATVQRPGEDPVVIKGRIPNEVGSIVTMPRSEVVHDPASACHRGLHVGTQSYARGYARGYAAGAMLEVHVNPRDVVSVPKDANGEKIRVCRYEVVKVLEDGFRYTSALRPEDEVETLDDADELVGRRFVDERGDQGTVKEDEDGNLYVEYDADEYGAGPVDEDDFTDDPDDGFYTLLPETPAERTARIHGKGGATSQAARGRGRNPAQDSLGRFSNGRPGSGRDNSGRFSS